MFDFLRTLFVYNEETYEEYYLTDLSRLIDLISSFALYVTIGVAVILLISFLLVRKLKPELLAGYKKIALGIIIGYSITTILLLGYLRIVYNVIDEKINTNFYLVLGLFALAVISTIVSICLKFFKPKAFKITSLILLGLCAIYAVVLVFVVPAKKDSYEPLSKVGMYGFSLLLVGIITALTLIFDRKTQEKSTQSKTIAYASICISLSFALSFVKFFTVGAQGGSVTFASLLPLMIFAYMFGAKKGVFAGVIYGFLQFIQSPQVYQPMQVLLDYPIAFGAIGLAGIFRNKKFLKGNMLLEFVLGAFVAVMLRYFAHTISGYYVFSYWAWEGYGALSYSLVYNLFCFVDLAVLLVPAIFMFSSKAFRNQMLKSYE